MQSISVTYNLLVGKRSFKKDFLVASIPPIGSIVSAAINPFIVTERIQFLDSYEKIQQGAMPRHLDTPELVRAVTNEEPEFHDGIIKELLATGWRERTR